MAQAQETIDLHTPAWVERGWMILAAMGAVSGVVFGLMLALALIGR